LQQFVEDKNTMNDGLDINEAQFMKLSTKERDIMIFRNVVHIRKQIKEYKLHKKIQYAWLSVLTVLVAAFYGIKNFIGF